jgi:hypothetical protein
MFKLRLQSEEFTDLENYMSPQFQDVRFDTSVNQLGMARLVTLEIEQDQEPQSKDGFQTE